jgi:hypothetical protein
MVSKNDLEIGFQEVDRKFWYLYFIEEMLIINLIYHMYQY